MNKKQAIERIQELVATEKINKCLEILRQPVTLAEFLDWEENTEYELLDKTLYKVIDNNLYFNVNAQDWIISNFDFCNYDISRLRQAKKVKEKKYYAKIKGVNLLNAQEDLRFFYFTKCKDGLVLSSKLYSKNNQVFTKQEWSKLGINDTNADFE